MGAPVADLQKLGLKLFTADGVAVAPREFVPIFHRWIQGGALSDLLLVDIADYEHVPEGPGVVLVAHDGNFSVDLGGGRMGLLYTRKQPAAGDLAARLHSLAKTVLGACQLLESDPALAGRMRFRGDRLQLIANDRLLAPNDAATLATLRPAVDALLTTLYGDGSCTVQHDPDPRQRLTLSVQAPHPVSVADLLQRL